MMSFRQYVPKPQSPVVSYKDLIKIKLEEPQLEKVVVDEYVDNLQPTIDATIIKQDNTLERKYAAIFAALERAKNNYIRYSIGLQSLKESIDKSEQLQRVKEDVNNYKSYSQKMQTDIDNLQDAIAKQVEGYKILKQLIDDKHSALKQQNNANLLLLRQINHLRTTMKKQKGTPDQSKPSKMGSNISINKIQSQNEIVKANSQNNTPQLQLFKQLQNENKILRYQINQSKNNKYLKAELFSQCMQTYRKYFEKTQKVVRQSGLQSSLLFEIKRAQLFMTEYQVRNHPNTFKSGLSGRQVRTLVHDTLKNMVDDKKNKKNKSHDVFIEWDTYKEFNAIQVLAMMCLKPRVFDELNQYFSQVVCQK